MELIYSKERIVGEYDTFSFVHLPLQSQTWCSHRRIKCSTEPEYNFASKQISWDLF